MLWVPEQQRVVQGLLAVRCGAVRGLRRTRRGGAALIPLHCYGLAGLIRIWPDLHECLIERVVAVAVAVAVASGR
jgi:hypothetical protein